MKLCLNFLRAIFAELGPKGVHGVGRRSAQLLQLVDVKVVELLQGVPRLAQLVDVQADPDGEGFLRDKVFL